jgi:hypothetical protein
VSKKKKNETFIRFIIGIHPQLHAYVLLPVIIDQIVLDYQAVHYGKIY